MLDTFYISVYNHIKKRSGKGALRIALYYIVFLELLLLFLLGIFFMAFAKQMKLQVMSDTKAIVLFVIIGLFIFFKNWMRYNGKRRTILNAKSNRVVHPVWKLVLFPILCVLLAVILLQIA